MNHDSDLSQAIAALTQQDGLYQTPLAGLKFFRSSVNHTHFPVIYKPAICVVANGQKLAHLGDENYSYDPNHYLLNSITLPMEASILGASSETPYLGLALDIDHYMISQLMLEMDRFQEPPAIQQPADIISASQMTQTLTQAFIQLVECSHHTMDREILANQLQRQIYYEVLKGPHAHVLRNCVASSNGTNRIVPVVQFIQDNFQQTLDIEMIANVAGMSTSSLHEHFKNVTSLSPMQFVKNLRLHHAHSMLLSGNPVSEASYHVGYSSPSQFSREFKRFFGSLPSEIQGL